MSIKRGIIHFHSNYSFDSLLKINYIKKWAIKQELDFICLTDHNTLKGSQKLRKDLKHTDIEVVLGAEYNTEFGDVVGLFLKENIINYDSFDNLVEEIRRQGGLVLFPHPFKGHKKIEYIAQHADLIEVFNSRTSDDLNELGNKISSKYQKRKSYGSDAHNCFELNNAIVEIEVKDSLKNSLKKNKMVVSEKIKTTFYSILFSQFVKSFKKRDFRLLKSNLRQTVFSVYEGKIFSHV
ncbi:MAG: PHP domain-containing protein [Candidatus Thermoplasmatota archaeon]